MSDDFYKILGVSRDAKSEEIKRAYLKLAHKYHPDKAGGDEKKFKEINEAYQVLGNAEKRARYDRFGRTFAGAGSQQGGFGAGAQGWDFGGFGSFGGGEWNVNFGGDMGGLEDIIENLFGGRGRSGGRRTYRRGGDLELQAEITLEDAKTGKTINPSFATLVECAKCSGVGHNPKGGFTECSYCNGRGETREERRTFFGNFAQVRACKKCQGAGKTPNEPCKTCGATGRIKGVRPAVIEIRPGVEDGQIIKIKGMGEAGEHGMEPGDLYVRVHVKPHPVFTRKGDDINISVPMSIIDILLGKRKEVKNLGGESVSFEAPAGFNLKDEIRVKGKGITSLGDLVIKPEIRAPKHLSAKAKKLLEDLEGEL